VSNESFLFGYGFCWGAASMFGAWFLLAAVFDHAEDPEPASPPPGLHEGDTRVG